MCYWGGVYLWRMKAMLNKLTLKDIQTAGKRVFVRCDFNVPVDKAGSITDDTRIRAALPTIQYLIESGAKVILASHFGRPKDGPVDEFRLTAVAARLSKLLGKPVIKTDDCIGAEAEAAVAAMKPGDVVLLENVRFHKEEEKNDPAFAAKLAALADVYVNDAFGTAHRAHASTAGIAAFLPAAAGFLLQKELDFMGKAITDPDRPFVAILGGAKVSDKIGVINNLIDKCDVLLIGGGMAYTFFAAKGYGIGKSLLDAPNVETAKQMLAKAEAKGVKLLLPVDTTVADAFSNDANFKVVPSSEIPEGWQGLDIGPETQRLFADAIAGAKTVIWNGPMGVFEMPNFAKGTIAVAEAMAASSAITIVGGGDSAAAMEQLGFADRISHISTGGGASLEFLEGKALPGVTALTDKKATDCCGCSGGCCE